MNKLCRRMGRRRGFTIIEMVVVITIMLLMMGIIMGSIKKMQVSQTRGESVSRLRALARALQLYRADYGDVPPYNPTGADLLPPAGADPHGLGLYALVLLDYVQSYRFLNDPVSTAEAAWVDAGGNRLEIVPDSPESLASAHNTLFGGSITPDSMTPQQEYAVFNVLADPAVHGTPAGPYARALDYDEESSENFCSWMMQDPLTREWKYQPIRRTTAGVAEPAPPAGFPVDDSTQPLYYHRQLSSRLTGEDTPRYLPASDTVVTWSHLFRTVDTRTVAGRGEWGIDLVLYQDGHVAIVPAPDTSGGSWGPPRATLQPLAQ